MLVKPPGPKGKPFTVTVSGPGDAPDRDAIGWRLDEGSVRRLRLGIVTAAREQDRATVWSLQKMMLRSWPDTLVSVRPVTQRTAGRRTAGIDGQVALTARNRAEVAVRVHRTVSARDPLPVRRV